MLDDAGSDYLFCTVQHDAQASPGLQHTVTTTTTSASSNPSYDSLHSPWAYDPKFGIVHLEGCRICRHYMIHISQTESRIHINSLASASYISARAQRATDLESSFEEGFNSRQPSPQKMRKILQEYRSIALRYKTKLEEAQQQVNQMREQLLAFQGTHEKLCSQDVPDALGSSCPTIPAPDHSDSDSDSEVFVYVSSSNIDDYSIPDISSGPMKVHHAVGTPALSTGSCAGPDAVELNNPQISYSGPSYLKDLGIPKSPISPNIPVPPVEKIRELMVLAHCPGESDALACIKLLVSDAHATPPALRTEAHQVLLNEWRRPSFPLSPIAPVLPSVSPREYAYVDASNVGIGFFFSGQWEAWRLRNGWQQGGRGQGRIRSTQWAEAVAVQLGVWVMIKAGYIGEPVTLCSDNLQVVKAFSEGQPIGEPLTAGVIKDTNLLCQQLNIQLTVLWVRGVYNPADEPSRLNVGSGKPRISYSVEIPPYLQDVVMPYYQ
ncbi:hypothetical protein AN958_01083 [Leucoagaricus sp. SymC.cos]|nr:hypothetical protein AN958_01083 [Leucoagaricus sp. SymC.cos]